MNKEKLIVAINDIERCTGVMTKELVILKAELEFENTRAAPQWISVNDEYPAIGEKVLIRIPVCSNFNIENSEYKGEGQFVGAWCNRLGTGCSYDVTHWQPLPKEPTQ